MNYWCGGKMRIVSNTKFLRREAQATPQAGLETIEGRLFAQKSLQLLQYLLAVLGRQRVEGLGESNDRSGKCNQKNQQNFVRFSHVVGASTTVFTTRLEEFFDVGVGSTASIRFAHVPDSYSGRTRAPGARCFGSRCLVNAFDNSGDTLPHADAHGREAVATAAFFHFVNERRHDSCAAAAEGVTESNGATVNVQFRGIDAELSNASNHLGSKGFV